MRNVLTICLSGHWAVVFALSAAQAADRAYHGMGVAAVATGEMLVATLFLWSAVSAWAGRAQDAGDTVDIARLAVGLGGIMLAVVAVHGGPAETSSTLPATALQLAALGVSFLVMRAEQGRDMPGRSEGGNAARRLAVAAAHGTRLSRLSMREHGG